MNWKKVKLEDVCKIIAGQSPPSNTYNKEKIGLPFFQGKADFGLENPNVRMWCSAPQKIANPNDILLSVRAPVGPTNICDQESCIGRGLCAIRAGEEIQYRFLLYYFKKIESALSESGVGSTFSAITQADIKSLQIPLPDLPTQQHIADVLDKADALRQQNQQLLTHYDELLQSTFIALFGDPVKNEMGWEVKKLGEVCEKIQIGPFGSLLHQEDYISGGIPLVNPTHIKNLKIVPDEKLTVSEEKYCKLINYHLATGDIIMGRRGEMGRCALITQTENGWLCGTGSLFIRPLKNMNSQYLVQVLSSDRIKTVLDSESLGITMANLNAKIVNNLKLISPPIVLQNHFAEIVEKIEAQKEQTQVALAESEALFEGLLAGYFGENQIHTKGSNPGPPTSQLKLF